MKTKIPYSEFYCHDDSGNICPWWTRIATLPCEERHKYCELKDICEDDCSVCNEAITYCKYLNHYEIGQGMLWDQSKICDVNLERQYKGGAFC